MAMGGAGSGKSFNFYTIAKRALATGSDAKFYVVDTDESVGAMLSDDAFVDSLLDENGSPINIEFADVGDWTELTSAVDKFQKKMRVQDWLMVDMLGPSWDMVQNHYTNTVFHSDLGDYFLQKRAAMKNPQKDKMFEGWVDWPVINGMYKDLQNSLLRSPGNLYVCNEGKALSRDQAEKDTAALFGPYGVVPVGQKRNPHLFQTILWTQEIRPGHREVIVIKDRGRESKTREKMQGKKIGDFAMQYLVSACGWKLT